jgi:hypothetical protein
MGKCKYCEKDAGLLRSEHKECKSKYENGRLEIALILGDAISSTSDFQLVKTNIDKLALDSFIKTEGLELLYTSAFDSAVAGFLDDGILSDAEEGQLVKFQEQFSLSQDVLDKNGSFLKVVRAGILRDLTEGIVPDSRITPDGHMPFMLQKDEKLIWIFQGVNYYEQKTRTQYQGRYSGVSLRVAKGVYYRTGGFRGHTVKIEEMKYIDTGIFGLTNKHVYFASSTKNLRVPLATIITMDPYEDGIGLQKDGTTAKPQVFKNIDGWFVYNAISNLI